jgi:hypothetical protein
MVMDINAPRIFAVRWLIRGRLDSHNRSSFGSIVNRGFRLTRTQGEWV